MNHILVADDDPDIRRLLSRALRREGYSVETAGDGREALDQIEANRPKLVLLDLMMPRVTGWEVYARLHGAEHDDLPIIVITADANLDRAQRILPDAEIMAKPFDIDELFSAVGRHCERGSQESCS